MIGKLKGEIDSIKPSELLIDVNGVGYVVSIPFSTFSVLAQKTTASLYIHTHVREDQIRLFGFSTEAEKKLFETLIQISGIGPAVALSVLSGVEPDRLYEAVQNNNPSVLTSIPGIGKSKAEKLVFELKRKFKKPMIPGEENSGASLRSDAIEALVSLGFDEKSSMSAIDNLQKDNPSLKLEDLIKGALQGLSSK